MDIFPLFQSGAILASDKPVKIWGFALEEQTISVFMDGQSLGQAQWETSGSKHKWSFSLEVQKAGGPHKIEIKSEDGETIVLEDIYFGLLFLLAGQSNMQLPMNRCVESFPPEVRSLEDSRIKEVRLPIKPAFYPEESAWNEAIEWKALNPENLYDIGGLGLSLAMHIRENQDIPVGLINVAAGGTPQESWLPYERLNPAYQEKFKFGQDPSRRQNISRLETEKINNWYDQAEAQRPYLEYCTSLPAPQMFFGTAIEESAYHGLVQLRSSFDLSDEDYAQVTQMSEMELSLGLMDSHDVSYLNGHKIGETTYQYPPRKYKIPTSLLRPGQNDLVVDLYIARNPGGLIPTKFYGLRSLPENTEENFVLSFNRPWELYWAKSLGLEPMPPTSFWDRLPSTNYRSYLEPIEDLSLSGMAWYQGESNDSRPDNYEPLLYDFFSYLTQESLAKDLPVVLVQLPAYDDPNGQMTPGSWVKIRQAQKKVAQTLGLRLVVAMDLGEDEDLHPQDKWNLGQRVYQAFLSPDTASFGPQLLSAECRDNKLDLHFSEPVCFPDTIRDSLKVYAAGKELEIEKIYAEENHVYLLIEKAGADKVAYLQANAPARAYLQNEKGLLVSPFRLNL